MSTLRVMTFNVRQPDANDGPDCWQARRALLADTIRECDPDVIGTQELFVEQADYIQSRAPQYAWFGSGRFGDTRDKHVGIFYKKDRFRVSFHGDWWLSETPDVPGSCSWDIIRPRQITWGVLEGDDLGSFWVFNTHFPYRQVEEEARRRTALLIKQRMTVCNGSPALLTADFNSPADGEVHELLCGDLRDAWCDAAERSGPAGTLNGFGRHTSDRRIDWILFRAPWRVLNARTVTTRRGERYPSDHFPVVATFATQPVP
jgi:endonuclease/exonuclease/phosphatase family metal-dependent hydrolase